MGDNIVIAFVCPEPKEPTSLAVLIEACKSMFADIPDVKVHMAKAAAAETVEFFLTTGELPVDKEVANNDYEDSGLVRHARQELAAIGEKDPWMVEGIVNVVKAFAKMGHSGGSASVAIPLINDLLLYRPISPLTDNPDEWMKVDEEIAGPGVWQSRRNPEAFSKDGGKTYYLLSEGGNQENPNPIHISEKRKFG